MRQLKLVFAVLMVFTFTGINTTYAGQNEGITCIDIGDRETAEYDKGRNGRDVNRRITVNSSFRGGRCMGRCGAGCGNFLPDAYTKDCLDHDICISDQGGANDFANDANCGDEFNQAADDFIFGVLRGCRG